MGDKKKVYLNFRNNLIMLTKNLPLSQSIWKIPFRIVLDNIAGVKGLLRGSNVAFMAITKAQWHYLKWLFSKRKKTVSVLKKTTKLHGIYHGFIIWKYFIEKKKTFSEIVKTKNDF